MSMYWLWDSSLSEKKVKAILKEEKNPRFEIYAAKMLSRVSDPKEVFDLIDRTIFCRKWPAIKKRMKRDSWTKDKVLFWQTIYARVYEKLKEEGEKIRKPREEEIPPERMRLAHQIRKIRKKSGLTQKDMADKLGVIQQYISAVETGHENFSIDTLKRIAEALGKDLIVEMR
ncbi:MAG: helix-turn-helix transcriptional regulator [Candidatus Omnitrophota bacterium]